MSTRLPRFMSMTTGTSPAPDLATRPPLRCPAACLERQNLLGNFVRLTIKPMHFPSGMLAALSTRAALLCTPTTAFLRTSTVRSLPIKTTSRRGVVNNDYETLQPRVGFSEDLFGNGKTVLRGGFGTFYERIQGNDIFGVATSAPFDPSLGLNNVYFSQPGKRWNTGAVIQPTSPDLCRRRQH